MEKLEKTRAGRTTLWQTFTVFCLNFSAFLQGYSVSSSSVILGQLKHSNGTLNLFANQSQFIICSNNRHDDITITEDQATWIASGWMLGHLFSSLFAGLVSDLLGRRRALLIDIVIFFIGFALCCFGRSFELLVFGRILQGYPLVSQVFVCEVVSVEKRGPLSAMYSVMHSIGFATQLIIGAYMHWRYSLMIPLCLCVPAFLGVYCLHESPEWLLRKRHLSLAERSASFYQLNNFQEKIDEVRKQDLAMEQDPFREIPEEIRESANQEKITLRTRLQSCDWINKNILRKICLLSLFYVLLGWCGFVVLASYAVDIFRRSGAPVSPEHACWITALVKIPAALASFFVIRKFSRRGLFIVLSFIICLSFLTAGVYTWLNSFPGICPELMQKLVFIPMLMIILAYAAYGCGFGCLPQLLTAEITPVPIRSSVVGFVSMLEMCSSWTLSNLNQICCICLVCTASS